MKGRETNPCFLSGRLPQHVALAQEILQVMPADTHELRPRTLPRRRTQPPQPARLHLVTHPGTIMRARSPQDRFAQLPGWLGAQDKGEPAVRRSASGCWSTTAKVLTAGWNELRRASTPTRAGTQSCVSPPRAGAKSCVNPAAFAADR